MLSRIVSLTIFVLLLGAASDGPLERWANAVGGRERVAAITSIYREATLQYGPYEGTLKVWHTADGRYRKEEHVATYALVETFDGTGGMVKQGDAPAHTMTPAELTLATSRRFANANAMLYAFFPERRRGGVTVENDTTIVLKPEGGVDWRIALDAQTGLPKTMVHQEGDQTIMVTYESYETVDGITFEKVLRRSAPGGPGATIRFTKTVLNVPVAPSLFTISS